MGNFIFAFDYKRFCARRSEFLPAFQAYPKRHRQSSHLTIKGISRMLFYNQQKKRLMMNKLKAVVFIIVCFVLLPVRAGIEALSHPVIPNGFGLNIHFTGEPYDLDMIAAAGFKFIRMDLV